MMRRKSERNKGKSPETKVEKPKRGRPSRRRKKSSSSSPERVSVTEEVPDTQEIEISTPEETPLIVPATTNVPSEDEDTEQVWHVKASESSGDTGEIQKLKICLSRPSSTPERPDRSPRGRKKLNRTSQLEFSSESSEEKRKYRHRSRKGSTKESSNTEGNYSSDNAERDIVTLNDAVVSIAQSAEVLETETVPKDSASTKSDSINADEEPSDSVLVDSVNLENISSISVSEDKHKASSPQEHTKGIELKTKEDLNVGKPTNDLSCEQNKDEEPSNVNSGSTVHTVHEHLIKMPSSNEEAGNSIMPETKESMVVLEPNDMSKDGMEGSPKKVTPIIPEVSDTTRQLTNNTTSSDKSEISDNAVVKDDNFKNDGAIDVEKDVSTVDDVPNKCVDVDVATEAPNTEVITESTEIVVNSETAEKCASLNISSVRSSDNPKEVFLPSTINELTKNVMSNSQNTVENPKNQEISQESISTANIRKRKWGSRSSKVAKSSTLSISTDSLKNLISHVEPVSVEDVLMDDKPKELEEVVLEVKSSEDRKANGKYHVLDKKEKDILGNLSHRKISIVNEEIPKEQRPPSPPKYKSSCILYITNLVRPFTLPLLKNLLQRTGRIVENGFWIDRIKSRCYVQYQNEDEAIETRHALHGVTWPVSNPKTLNVDFGAATDMRNALASGEDEKLITHSDPWSKDIISRDIKISGKENDSKMFEKRTVVREWDMGKGEGRDERPERPVRGGVHPLDGERRKRRSKSPSPARKFKKKEEEAPSKLLDDLFKKTKATPCIYWLPLNAETILVKEEQRRKHMAEHERRLEELRRVTEERKSRVNPSHHPPSHRHR